MQHRTQTAESNKKLEDAWEAVREWVTLSSYILSQFLGVSLDCGKVEERLEDSFYQIKGLQSTKHQVMHFDRLKPCHPNMRFDEEEEYAPRNTVVRSADIPVHRAVTNTMACTAKAVQVFGLIISY